MVKRHTRSVHLIAYRSKDCCYSNFVNNVYLPQEGGKPTMSTKDKTLLKARQISCLEKLNIGVAMNGIARNAK